MSTDCRLSEPDGTLVSHGRVQRSLSGALNDVIISGIDNPGRLINRCLIGPVRQVLLHLGDGPAHQALVHRVRFDPKLGRVCVLHLTPDNVSLALPQLQ